MSAAGAHDEFGGEGSQDGADRPALDAGLAERYADQLQLPGWGEQAQVEIARLTAFVVGAGALGSAAAAYLVGAGIGRLAVVDGGQIAIAEMPRQLLHFTPEVGMGKADSAAAKLSLLNPEVHVDPFPADVTADNADVILMDADVVLDCSSRAAVRLLVNDACVGSGTPFASAATGGYDGAYMVVRPRDTACCRCLGDDVDGPGFGLPSRSAAGVYGPTTGVIGSLMAHAAIAILLGATDPGAGLLRRFDGATGEWSAARPSRRPDCICANGSVAGNV